ncbi:MAG: hypothetical protein OEW27_12665 [Aquincola sp.]|nr:hypothetical protein [Aquincola sp.]MDH5330793.1 hypothetical protein [Aquincola sp.]
MDDRTSRLESAVEHLQLTVQTLQQRLDAIEAKVGTAAGAVVDSLAQGPAAAPPNARPARTPKKDPYDPITMLSHVGRLLLVLAGGFFLRAMTDAGALAVPVGIGLAFAYAAVWLVMSHLAGGRGQEPNAVFHALAAALVAFPLSVEATTRFNVLTGLTGALAVSALSAGLLFVAWRRRLRALAWITVIGALPVSAALLIKTGVVVPFALYLIALGVATLWLSYAVDWWGARWLAAVAADIAVAGVTLRAFAAEPRDTPQAAMLLQLLLFVGYFGSIAYRTLVRGRDVSRFEVVQTVAVLAVSLGGAVFMWQAAHAVPAVLGVAALLVGATCYGVATAVVERRAEGALNFYFYTTLALVLVLAGFTIAVDSVWLGAVFACFGVLGAGLWSRLGRLFMLLHGAVYLVAAGIVSGALGYGLRTLVAGAEGPWRVPGAVMLLVLAATVLCAALAARRSLSSGDEVAVGTRFVITIVLVWLAAGSLIGLIAPLAGTQADRSVDPGVLATVSTGVLSMATLVIAWIGGRIRFREWGWLVYPLLVGIGLKLVTQDFKHSRPATLFIALALYGTALIVAPRLRRLDQKANAEAGA